MAILSSLLLDALQSQRRQSRIDEMRARLGPAVQAAVGTEPVLRELPTDQMGPPELVQPGSGLLANPMDLENQIRFGAALLEQPELQGAGSSFINAALAQAYSTQRAEQDRALQRELTSERLHQGAQQFDRRFNQTEYWNALQASRAREAQDLQLLAGKPGEGYGISVGPDGPFHYGVPGSKPWLKAEQELTRSDQAIRTLDELIGKVEQHDKQTWGADLARMKVLYGETVSNVLKMREFGTPQEGELARIESELLSPERGNWKRKGTVLASLRQARELFRQSLQSSQHRYRWWPGLGRFYESDYAGSTYLPPHLRGSERIGP